MMIDQQWRAGCCTLSNEAASRPWRWRRRAMARSCLAHPEGQARQRRPTRLILHPLRRSARHVVSPLLRRRPAGLFLHRRSNRPGRLRFRHRHHVQLLRWVRGIRGNFEHRCPGRAGVGPQRRQEGLDTAVPAAARGPRGKGGNVHRAEWELVERRRAIRDGWVGQVRSVRRRPDHAHRLQRHRGVARAAAAAAASPPAAAPSARQSQCRAPRCRAASPPPARCDRRRPDPFRRHNLSGYLLNQADQPPANNMARADPCMQGSSSFYTIGCMFG